MIHQKHLAHAKIEMALDYTRLVRVLVHEHGHAKNDHKHVEIFGERIAFVGK